MHKKFISIIGLTAIILTPIILLASNTQADTYQDILKTSWNNYKNSYIQSDGAVRRPDQGNDVVSEGVGYAMMRAVWMNDQPTFDKVYNFAETKLSRKNNKDKNDNLLAWHWNGGVIDWGAASDADLDYAIALAFASKRWTNPTNGLQNYKDKSIAVQKDILALETGWVGDKIYLQPGTWFAFQAPIPVNPSYLSPAYYKIFDQMAPDPRWTKLTDSAYDVVWKSSRDLNGTVGVGLPADWVQVNSDNSVSKSPNLGIDYRYDAFRTNWRFALDYVWFNDQRAKTYLTLSGARNTLLNDFKKRGLISAEYAHDGRSLSSYENPGVYGVNIGWFIPENQDTVNQFVTKIQNAYNTNGGKFFAQPNYYMENWAWLGLALGTNNLPNLYGAVSSDSAAQQTSTPEPTASTVPTVAPLSATPVPTTAVATPLSLVQSSGQIQILYPSNNSTINGTITMQVKNTYPNNHGTWWSVDSGGWVNMSPTAPGSTTYQAIINISSWNWSSNGTYTLHAWSKDANGNQQHTQITFHK